jgi:integrase
MPLMQRGQIYKHRSSWLLRYWDVAIVNGERKRIRKAVRLAAVDKDYPTKRSVVHLADRVLVPLNVGQVQAESSLPVADFIENYYLPHVKRELKPSTYKDYSKDIFEKHLKIRLGDIRLRDFRTVHAQRILREIPEIGHTTRLRVKSFLSGAFKHALREGFLDGVNPVHNTSVPGRPTKFKGDTYTMSDIGRMTEAIIKTDEKTTKDEAGMKMKAFAVVSVAAFAGLRLSELRGLRWTDYDGQSLRIVRSVWRTHVGETKTLSSTGSVPVLPLLKRVLDDHRARVNGRDHEYMFAGERRGAPLNLANLARRVIIPSLPNSAADQQGPAVTWKGWHAFRRSLASNLYSCGVPPKIIQAILRHSDIGTTLQYYVQTPDDEARAALQRIEDWIAAI